jgi:DNA-binding MarR family transcriptional regulator
MIASRSGVHLDELAYRSFRLITRMMLGLPRNRRRDETTLKETEFLTLTMLRQHRMMIVGDIQRVLGILPAQMSRIIRSLEGRPQPLIECQINAEDKRKVNVNLTPAGEQMLDDYIAPRVEAIARMLGRLNDEDRELMAHLLGRLEVSGKRAAAE